MKATLISINKPHTDNIFTDNESRKKTVEWRTKPLPKGLHYVYETKNKGGCGKVIGEMTIVENMKYGDVSAIPHETILKGRVGARALDLYANGRPLYENVIINAKRYDNPKELWESLATPALNIGIAKSVNIQSTKRLFLISAVLGAIEELPIRRSRGAMWRNYETDFRCRLWR